MLLMMEIYSLRVIDSNLQASIMLLISQVDIKQYQIN